MIPIGKDAGDSRSGPYPPRGQESLVRGRVARRHPAMAIYPQFG